MGLVLRAEKILIEKLKFSTRHFEVISQLLWSRQSFSDFQKRKKLITNAQYEGNDGNGKIGIENIMTTTITRIPIYYSTTNGVLVTHVPGIATCTYTYVYTQ